MMVISIDSIQINFERIRYLKFFIFSIVFRTIDNIFSYFSKILPFHISIQK